MKIYKLMSATVASAVIGLTISDALTGHGMKGNGDLNPVALGINVICKCDPNPGCRADNTGAICAGGDNILCTNWDANCSNTGGGSTNSGSGDTSNPGSGGYI